MSQVVKSQQVVEGVSKLDVYGNQLVVCGVEERVILLNSNLEIENSLEVELGVIDCRSKNQSNL
jgi:hypothetical protein